MFGLVKARRRAFTLIELLTVMSLIVALVTIGALALGGRGGEGVALANAQTTLSGLVGAARAQAALHQTTARLVVYATLPPTGDWNKYLRACVIVRQEPPNATSAANSTWVAASDITLLPSPICFVPPSPVPASHLNTGVVWLANPAPVSSVTTAASFSYGGQLGTNGRPVGAQFFGLNGTGRAYYIEFGPDGSVTDPAGLNPAKLAVAPAVLAANAVPKFNNASAVRGLFVRKSGALSMVNDATGF